MFCGRCCVTEPHSRPALRLDIFIEILPLVGWIRLSLDPTGQERSMIHIDFSPDDCAACPSRPSCTRAKDLPRALIPNPVVYF